MISTNRLFLLLALAAGLVVASTSRAEAQIIYSYPPPFRYASADASIRIEVTPKQAEVFIDGYYAGIVDDFDGPFQRLHAEPGQHDITVYLNGYRSLHQSVYLMPDKTFKLKQKMEPLAAGEMAEARPTPMPQPEAIQGGQTGQPGPFPGQPGPFPRGRGGRPGPGQFPPANPGPPNQPAPGNAPAAQVRTGSLSVDLQPADAEVMLDGQPLSGPQGRGPLVIDLSEGRHVLQVRKSGFVGYLTEIQIRAGQTTNLTVNLRPQP